jgi:cytosine/uracil/thiamine/allantoin permease
MLANHADYIAQAAAAGAQILCLPGNLLRTRGVYEYSFGFNAKALGAGIPLALLGLVVPPLAVLYKYAWFVGFFASGIIYYALMAWTGEKYGRHRSRNRQRKFLDQR